MGQSSVRSRIGNGVSLGMRDIPLFPLPLEGLGSEFVSGQESAKNVPSEQLIASLHSRLAQACVHIDRLRRQGDTYETRVEFLQHALETERARGQRAVRGLRELHGNRDGGQEAASQQHPGAI